MPLAFVSCAISELNSTMWIWKLKSAPTCHDATANSPAALIPALPQLQPCPPTPANSRALLPLPSSRVPLSPAATSLLPSDLGGGHSVALPVPRLSSLPGSSHARGRTHFLKSHLPGRRPGLRGWHSTCRALPCPAGSPAPSSCPGSASVPPPAAASWLEVTTLRSAPCLPQPGHIDHRTRGL